jgi:hypothetical protein
MRIYPRAHTWCLLFGYIDRSSKHTRGIYICSPSLPSHFFMNHILLCVCLYFFRITYRCSCINEDPWPTLTALLQNMKSGIPRISYLSSRWFFQGMAYDIPRYLAYRHSDPPCQDLTFGIPTITYIYTNRRGDDVKIWIGAFVAPQLQW